MLRVAIPLLFLGCSTSQIAPPSQTPPPPVLQTGWVDIDAIGLKEAATNASGRSRIVNFWATWCAPCIAEIPLLTEYGTTHPEVDLLFVSIDHPGVRRRGQAVLDDVGLAGQRVLHLNEVDASSTLRSTISGWSDAVPLTLVIGPDGQRKGTFPYAINAAILDAALEDTP